MRAPGQLSDGTYSATGSKTVAVPIERLFEAFADDAVRALWLPDAKVRDPGDDAAQVGPGGLAGRLDPARGRLRREG